MLLNLSTHPSSQWQEKQKAAAIEKYGSIQDLAFPEILPEADAHNLRNLVETYLASCLEMFSTSTDSLNAVHLMGEMTFTFGLVALLQKNNILCVASTTRREATINDDGSKTIRFSFVKFREYPKLLNA
jgi:hypothetical protein